MLQPELAVRIAAAIRAKTACLMGIRSVCVVELEVSGFWSLVRSIGVKVGKIKRIVNTVSTGN
jgi:hypothetical protein